ncbi:hypothetical protein F441_10414 [Phytophthora nicotianae CJ01A1]|uniref:Uncharacterized protein n=1 Tax=Phytophthora nicotianae CJ01A1 TaxID=1317063 RepID=W2WVU3_PHYNI|nr:hypothetical protein F441_10414 [Phytophthora nicotianae CJ01A1]
MDTKQELLWGLYQTTATHADAADGVQTTSYLHLLYTWTLEDRVNTGLHIQLRVRRIISGFLQQAPVVGAAELECAARSL